MSTKHRRSINAALLGGAVLAASPALAAEVTPQRLANPEPQNWLMNHRTYDGQRFSPLDKINKDNVKGLKLAYAVALGGTSTNENLEATPLVEDGFMYVVDLWGIVYKIDVRSGDTGRIVWRMDPKQEKQGTNRGAAFWGNLVISPANWPASERSTPCRYPIGTARPPGRRSRRWRGTMSAASARPGPPGPTPWPAGRWEEWSPSRWRGSWRARARRWSCWP